MNAIDISGQAPGGPRDKLIDMLPLECPILLQFFPVYRCNFRCRYCTFSIPKEQRGFISNTEYMSQSLYKKCIDDLSEFETRPRVIRFVGMGEPLMQPYILNMISYATSATQRVEMLTNASLLNPRFSVDLARSGLKRLIISIQGTSQEKYEQISKVRNFRFDLFVTNIRYLYEHRGDMEIYIKIIDDALDSEEDKQRFFDIFGDICDYIGIEHVGPIYPGVEHNSELSTSDTTQFGMQKQQDCDICPQPFFTMQINPDGLIVPCYSIEYPEILGDCNVQSLKEIWNIGAKAFMIKMLKQKCVGTSVCSRCQINIHRQHNEDKITDSRELLRKYE